jgi:cellulose synthase/poly-beta-1,6-N-acetylglucosamine synthase-like glycosyltransferase
MPFSALPLPGLFLALFLATAAAYAALLLGLTSILRRIAQREAQPEERPAHLPALSPTVTVLVAARNEERNLPGLLDALLLQEWPVDRLQIVVVDDRSEDGTAGVLKDFAARRPERIKAVSVTALPPGVGPKKHALLRGLEHATGEWIVVTDADCTMDPGWLRALARHFGPDTGMVVGPSVFVEPPDGFGISQGAAALEFASYSVCSAAFIAARFPVIASANNLAYRRSAFDRVGGFARHAAVVNGDDDLLLQDLHHAGNVTVACATNADSVVRTLPPAGSRGFWEQRKRWAGTCLHYRFAPKAFLVALFAFYTAIAALLLAGAFQAATGDARLLGFGLAIFAIKTAADFVLLREGLRQYRLSALLRFFPLAAILHIPLVLAAVVAGSAGRRFVWKGQQLGRKA